MCHCSCQAIVSIIVAVVVVVMCVGSETKEQQRGRETCLGICGETEGYIQRQQGVYAWAKVAMSVMITGGETCVKMEGGRERERDRTETGAMRQRQTHHSCLVEQFGLPSLQQFHRHGSFEVVLVGFALLSRRRLPIFEFFWHRLGSPCLLPSVPEAEDVGRRGAGRGARGSQRVRHECHRPHDLG